MIASSAQISKKAKIGKDVSIGHFSIIEDRVEIANGCQIAEHVIIRSGTRLHEGCVVDSFCVLGGLPQDLKFDPKKETSLVVGEKTVLREGVTLHRATKEDQPTYIGRNCYLMGYSHIGHDCQLGNSVILANGALLGGHVLLGDFVFVGGSTPIHQGVRIGESTIVSGASGMSMDVPPFSMVAERNRISGLNLLGLKRRQFQREVIADIKECYFAVYKQGSCSFKANAKKALESGLAKTEEGTRFLQFFLEGNGSFVRRREKE